MILRHIGEQRYGRRSTVALTVSAGFSRLVSVGGVGSLGCFGGLVFARAPASSADSRLAVASLSSCGSLPCWLGRFRCRRGDFDACRRWSSPSLRSSAHALAASALAAAAGVGHRDDGVRRRRCAAGIRGAGLVARASPLADGRSEVEARIRCVGLQLVACPASAPLSLLGGRRIGFGRWRRAAADDLLRDQQRMREVDRRDLAGGDDHARAHPGPVPHLHGECHRQADAAVRRRIARQRAGVHRDARPGDALHVRHRRAAIDIGVVHLCLLDDAEHAHRRRMAVHAGRDRGFREQSVGVVDPNLLLLDRDRDDQRPLRLGAGFLSAASALARRPRGPSSGAAAAAASAGSSWDRSPASRTGGGIGGAAPRLPAAVSIAICQNRCLELVAAIPALKIRCPLTRIILNPVLELRSDNHLLSQTRNAFTSVRLLIPALFARS